MIELSENNKTWIGNNKSWSAGIYDTECLKHLHGHFAPENFGNDQNNAEYLTREIGAMEHVEPAICSEKLNMVTATKYYDYHNMTANFLSISVSYFISI